MTGEAPRGRWVHRAWATFRQSGQASWIPFLWGCAAGSVLPCALLCWGLEWVSTRRPTETVLAPVHTHWVTVEPLNQQMQYDLWGTVRYPERVHRLVSNERADQRDGLVQVTIDAPQARVALLDAVTGTPLWDCDHPRISKLWLDVKAGEYALEVDSYQADGTILPTVLPVRIGVRRPFRLWKVYPPGPDRK